MVKCSEFYWSPTASACLSRHATIQIAPTKTGLVRKNWFFPRCRYCGHWSGRCRQDSGGGRGHASGGFLSWIYQFFFGEHQSSCLGAYRPCLIQAFLWHFVRNPIFSKLLVSKCECCACHCQTRIHFFLLFPIISDSSYRKNCFCTENLACRHASSNQICLINLSVKIRFAASYHRYPWRFKYRHCFSKVVFVSF